MVARSSLIEAADAVNRAFDEFAGTDQPHFVRVFESSAGNLRAILATDRFKEVGSTARQILIWEFLKEHVPPEHLHHLSGVQTLDVDEYREAGFPGTGRNGGFSALDLQSSYDDDAP